LIAVEDFERFFFARKVMAPDFSLRKRKIFFQSKIAKNLQKILLRFSPVEQIFIS